MDDSDHRAGSFDLLNRLPMDQQVDVLRALIDVIPEAVLAHGPDGELVFWSDGACTLLGYTREEMMALKPFGWVDRDAIRGTPVRLETILHDGGLVFESRVVRKDGSSIPAVVTGRRIDTLLGPLVVSVIQDISSLMSANEELAFLANHDALTGVFNRRAFEERLGIGIADARRHGDNVVVAYIDLDGFRSVNDRFGHRIGDSVLAELAKRLVASVREQDVVARLGSDEFVLMLSRVRSSEELDIVAERLRAAIAEPLTIGDAELQPAATFGFALWDAEDDDANSLVLKADIAMSAAKRHADRTWLVWSDEMGAPPGQPLG